MFYRIATSLDFGQAKRFTNPSVNVHSPQHKLSRYRSPYLDTELSRLQTLSIDFIHKESVVSTALSVSAEG